MGVYTGRWTKISVLTRVRISVVKIFSLAESIIKVSPRLVMVGGFVGKGVLKLLYNFLYSNFLEQPYSCKILNILGILSLKFHVGIFLRILPFKMLEISILNGKIPKIFGIFPNVKF